MSRMSEVELEESVRATMGSVYADVLLTADQYNHIMDEVRSRFIYWDSLLLA